MCTTSLPTILASIATTSFQHQGSPQVNKFEQISSLGHHMSLTEGTCTMRSRLSKFEHAWGLGPVGQDQGVSVQWGPMSGGTGAWGLSVYSEVPCLGDQGHGVQCTVRSNASWVIVTWDPCGQIDWQTQMTETLPSCNFVGGGKNWIVMCNVCLFLMSTDLHWRYVQKEQSTHLFPFFLSLS